MKDEIKKIYDEELKENTRPSVFINYFDPRNCNMKIYLNDEERKELLEQYRNEWIKKNPKKSEKKKVNEFSKKLAERIINNESTDLADIFRD